MLDKFPKSRSFITIAAMKRFMKETSNLLVSSEAIEELIDELESIEETGARRSMYNQNF